MNGKLVLKCVAVFTVSALALAGNASAQWSGRVAVSNAVEPSPDGRSKGGVSASHCENSIVVGFGDSETGGVGSSFSGYAVSSDTGKTFRDLGVLPVSSQDSGFGLDQLGGRGNPDMPNTQGPSLGCASGNMPHINRFYYATTATSANDPQNCPGFPICSAISVSTSTDNGVTWSLPVFVARGSIDSHSLDSPALAVDNDTLYLAYVETNGSPIDSDFTFPDCQGSIVTEIRLAISRDAGTTWGTPLIIDHSCDISSDLERQGVLVAPHVNFAQDGATVYVTYEFQPEQSPNAPLPNEIRLARSQDQGSTISTTMVVSTNASLNALPHVAVDPSISNSFGAVYLIWTGLSASQKSTEVLVSDSLDQGASFSFPRPISAMSQGVQSSPVLDVDTTATVAACFYSTPASAPISAYICATSSNLGATWQTQRFATPAPVGFDALTRDSRLSPGFFTAFEVNSNRARTVVGSSNPQ